MAIARPEGESFNRFLISAGTAIVTLGLSVPWLLLREDGSLKVTEQQLSDLSPTAQSVIQHRQHWLERLQTGAPWFTVLAVAGGLGLLGWGAKRLYSRQGLDDAMAREQLEEQKQRVQVGKQPRAEIEARRVEEAESELDLETALASVQPGPTVRGTEEAVANRLANERNEFVSRIVRAEHGVLQGIARVIPAGGEVLLQPVVEGRGSQLSVRSDAILRFPSSAGGSGHVIVEVKLVRRSSASNNLRNRLIEVAGSVFIARDALGLRTFGWLIIVVDDEGTDAHEAWLETFADRARSLAPPHTAVEVVALSALDTWSPRSRLEFSTDGLTGIG